MLLKGVQPQYNYQNLFEKHFQVIQNRLSGKIIL